MSDKLNEQVSALMDDECTEQELKLAVRRLTHDTALMSYWERYHLISDVLKGDAPSAMNVDFARRIHAVIETEPALSSAAASPSAARPWTKPLAGFALAASVAAVAVFMLPREVDQPGTDALVAQERVIDQPVPVATVTTDAEDDMAVRMNAYMVNHNSLASMSSVYGVLPYVRMTGINDGR